MIIPIAISGGSGMGKQIVNWLLLMVIVFEDADDKLIENMKSLL